MRSLDKVKGSASNGEGKGQDFTPRPRHKQWLTIKSSCTCENMSSYLLTAVSLYLLTLLLLEFGPRHFLPLGTLYRAGGHRQRCLSTAGTTPQATQPTIIQRLNDIQSSTQSLIFLTAKWVTQLAQLICTYFTMQDLMS